MRALLLSWEYPPCQVGGLSRHVFHLGEALADQGVEVDVVTRGAPGAPAREERGRLRVLRVEPYCGPAPDFHTWVLQLNFALAEAGIRALSERHGPAVIHAHDWLVAHSAVQLKRVFRLPLVATVHATEHGRMGGIHHSGQKYINDVEWWLTYEAWRVICCSRSMQAEVEGLFSLPGDKVAVVPNGVVLPAPAASRPQAPARRGEGLLVYVGRLVPEKGAAVLLEAFRLVLDAAPGACLVVAGTGPYEAELKQRAAALELGDRVRFAGYVDDAALGDLYRCADAVVVPSTYEPFGIVALEAMAAGAAVVVSDVGGLGEIVTDGRDGLKVPAGQPGVLAHQLQRLLGDPGLRGRLGAGARATVAQRYLWPGVAAETLAVYRRVLTEYHGSQWRNEPAAGYGAAPPSGWTRAAARWLHRGRYTS